LAGRPWPIIRKRLGTSTGRFQIGPGVTLIRDNPIALDSSGLERLDTYTGFVLVKYGTLKMLEGSKITGVKLPRDSGTIMEVL
jgi:hypothetical protein